MTEADVTEWWADTDGERSFLRRRGKDEYLWNDDAAADYINELEALRTRHQQAVAAMESARWQASLSTMPFAQKIVRDLSKALRDLEGSADASARTA